jgi:hypothetical protein
MADTRRPRGRPRGDPSTAARGHFFACGVRGVAIPGESLNGGTETGVFYGTQAARERQVVSMFSAASVSGEWCCGGNGEFTMLHDFRH